MKRIVLTGGPCGGKTSCLPVLKQYFTGRGLSVVCLSETAAELITEGKKPFGETAYSFHKELVERQLVKEESVSADIILQDRGIADIRAYLSDGMFADIMAASGLDLDAVMKRYDGVIHLVTAADGAAEFYTCENEKTRSESASQAIEVDRRSLYAWKEYKGRIIIDNSTDFEGKISRVIHAVEGLL